MAAIKRRYQHAPYGVGGGRASADRERSYSESDEEREERRQRKNINEAKIDSDEDEEEGGEDMETSDTVYHFYGYMKFLFFIGTTTNIP